MVLVPGSFLEPQSPRKVPSNCFPRGGEKSCWRAETRRRAAKRKVLVFSNMASRLFEERDHAAFYQKYRFSPCEELQSLVFSYLEEKKVSSLQLAVDVGCGTGQSTKVLASRFDKVVGLDVSEAQIEEARQTHHPPNVSYIVCPAEELPFEDASVDLVTAFVAAHWFDIKRFMKELERVLKPHGCVVLSTYFPGTQVHYKDSSEKLTEIFRETWDLIFNYADERVNLVVNEYKEILEALPFQDKQRVTDIIDKIPLTVAGVIGYIQSSSAYQTFLKLDPEAAKSVLANTEQRLLEAMGVSSNDTQLEFWMRNVCVLGCKGS
uniref:Methyltransferase type 11 domain-containing protein n=1 Tax=Sphenodon punctatus TaxID=8508 RepID=A0A8D0HJT3_SPHPU